jgi:hypothetical protein
VMSTSSFMSVSLLPDALPRDPEAPMQSAWG